MKVNINETSRDILYDDLNVGDLFYSFNGAYIKIDVVNDGNDLYNAVLLEDGSLEYIRHCQYVTRLDGELNVKMVSE